MKRLSNPVVFRKSENEYIVSLREMNGDTTQLRRYMRTIVDDKEQIVALDTDESVDPVVAGYISKIVSNSIDIDIGTVYKEQFDGTRGFINITLDKSPIHPRRSTAGSACYDVFNNTQDTYVIEPGAISNKIPTGVVSYMKDDEVLMAYVRSGMGFKHSIRLCNGTGIIDSDYNREIFVKFHNHGSNTVVIKPGDAMLQVMFTKYLISETDDITVGGDRTGGFGSTGN